MLTAHHLAHLSQLRMRILLPLPLLTRRKSHRAWGRRRWLLVRCRPCIDVVVVSSTWGVLHCAADVLAEGWGGEDREARARLGVILVHFGGGGGRRYGLRDREVWICMFGWNQSLEGSEQGVEDMVL